MEKACWSLVYYKIISVDDNGNGKPRTRNRKGAPLPLSNLNVPALLPSSCLPLSLLAEASSPAG